MANHAELPIHWMLPSQERQHWFAPPRQPVHRDRKSHIATRILQARLQSIDGIILATRRRINLSKIEIELRLVPLHADGGVAESLRLAPLLFGAREHHSKVGHVIRIVPIEFHGALHMRQCAPGKVIPQQIQTCFELAESFRIEHRFTSMTVLRPSSLRYWKGGNPNTRRN